MISPPLAQREIATSGCATCCWAAVCGGRHIHANDMFGCFDRCHGNCSAASCDLTCPNNPDIFWRRWTEVGGLETFPHHKFPACNGNLLPSYLSMIRSGMTMTRNLRSNFIALTLYEVLVSLRGKRGYEHIDRREFRKRWSLRADCRILVVGVGKDPKIEGFYRKHRTLIPLLANLDLHAVTVPNFSYFSDSPRPHILYNRKRGLRVADKLIEHGIRVVPHFNAINWTDWVFWTELLRESPGLSVFCKEFQTGNRLKVNYERTVANMAQMQNDVGRNLHPIVIAGLKAIELLKQHFQTFTLIDSTPSIKAKNWQVLDESTSHGAKLMRSPSSADLVKLLDHNVFVRTQLVRRRIAHAQSNTPARPPRAKTPGQGSLKLV
jgi:Domain of unknown function (DUF4417)